MQAASTVRGFGISRQGAGFVIGLMAALLIGGLAGFAAKTWTNSNNAAVTTVAAPHEQAPDAIDRNAALRGGQAGSPQSDLTRALPSPGAVVAPVEIPGRQFGVPQADYVPGSEYAVPNSEYVGDGYYIP